MTQSFVEQTGYSQKHTALEDRVPVFDPEVDAVTDEVVAPQPPQTEQEFRQHELEERRALFAGGIGYAAYSGMCE